MQVSGGFWTAADSRSGSAIPLGSPRPCRFAGVRWRPIQGDSHRSVGETGFVSAIEQPAAVGATLDDLRVRRAEILDVARNRGAREVRVFGSIARGSAAGDSDVDLLVAFEAGRSLFDVGGLVAGLEVLLGRSVDVVTTAELRAHVRERELADAVTL